MRWCSAVMSDVSYVYPPSDLTTVRGIDSSGTQQIFLPSSNSRNPEKQVPVRHHAEFTSRKKPRSFSTTTITSFIQVLDDSFHHVLIKRLSTIHQPLDVQAFVHFCELWKGVEILLFVLPTICFDLNVLTPRFTVAALFWFFVSMGIPQFPSLIHPGTIFTLAFYASPKSTRSFLMEQKARTFERFVANQIPRFHEVRIVTLQPHYSSISSFLEVLVFVKSFLRLLQTTHSLVQTSTRCQRKGRAHFAFCGQRMSGHTSGRAGVRGQGGPRVGVGFLPQWRHSLATHLARSNTNMTSKEKELSQENDILCRMPVNHQWEVIPFCNSGTCRWDVWLAFQTGYPNPPDDSASKLHVQRTRTDWQLSHRLW